MSQFHHSMFDNITFPDGWIETISYNGENWKETMVKHGQINGLVDCDIKNF